MRLLPQLTFAVNFHFEGTSYTTGYHLVNLLLHWVNGLLLFTLVRALSPSIGFWIPLTGSLLFIWHPLHTNSVTYLLQRNGLMATLFYLAGFIAFLQFRHNSSEVKSVRWGLVAVVSWGMAVFSKEMAVTLPLLWLTHEGIQTRYNPLRWKRTRQWGRWVLLSFLILGSGFIYFFETPRGVFMGNTPLSHHGLWTHFLTMSRVLVHDWRMLWFPFPDWMNIDHDFSLSHSIWNVSVITAIFFHSLMIGGAFYCLKRHKRFAGFGILWFYLTWLPYLFIPENEVLVEYKTYLPSIGWVMLVVELLLFSQQGAMTPRGPLRSGIKYIGIGCVLGGFFYGTLQRNAVFETDVGLWEDTVKKSPQKIRAHHNLAVAYHHAKRYDEAIMAFHKTLTLAPTHLMAYKNLAASYEQKRDYPQAVAWFSKALDLNPEYTEAQLGLGHCYFKMRQWTKAVSAYRLVLDQEPRFHDQALQGMIRSYLQLNSPKQADYVLTLYLRKNPGSAWAKSLRTRLQALSEQ